MGAVIPLIVGLIPAGIQLEQFLQGLFTIKQQIAIPNRPDVTDEQMALIDGLIDAVQARIVADAAAHP